MTIDLNRRKVTLLPQKAVLLAESLILADTHFGKSAAFRARGIPVPEGDTRQDTRRILDLLERHQPARLVVAGDFLHAPEGMSPAVLGFLSEFVCRLPCELHLVLGNHDLRAGTLPPDWPVVTHQALPLDGFSVVHDPRHAAPGSFSICGHLHPVARIRDGRNTGFRLPCFWVRKDQLILPSFGSFTGGAIAHPADHD
ncbi:MAG: ligase-associated DNA damage response endonuclease PdeM, partial [Akkermansiaceae bacterium]|nr:ligase-associated DNA damage response endonuclease PdeM [Akkermansiaceae bacterium]